MTTDQTIYMKVRLMTQNVTLVLFLVAMLCGAGSVVSAATNHPWVTLIVTPFEILSAVMAGVCIALTNQQKQSITVRDESEST